MNIDFWFENPFSLLHIVSWVLLIVSIIPAISGFYLLHAIGKPKDDFEATTNLVSTGIYKYIRHPLYASLICLAWGVYFKDVTTLTSLIVVVASVFLYVTAKNEEVENMLHFGVDYSEYMKRTKMFIPFVW
jgi:protein-S-isoprenylcysteine O-methyltransferase Ste14